MGITFILHDGPGRRAARRAREWGRRRGPWPLSIESLEVRNLLSETIGAGALPAYPPNETVDQAWDLGDLSQPTSMLGSVGSGSDGAADVTWYHFHLPDAARVDLSVGATPGGRPFAGVLSLFDSDPYDWGDPYDPDGYRLMAQVQADPQDGIASYTQDLGPGDYDLAISGAGNLSFSPVVAGSGLPGAIGTYELTAGATDLGLAGDGPAMLWADPAAGSVLDGSPLAIRVELSGPLDPATIEAGQTVQLLSVSDGVESPIPLASTNLSISGGELQLFPMSPLAPGQYLVQLSGDSSQGQPVLAGMNGLPLGEDAQHPDGADESFTFQVDGVDGVAGATASDDTPATARDLGDVAGAGIVQVAGAIGADPNLPDDPANQVDLYHFRIDGPGRYAMLAEVDAGRIGSPLDPGLSLWELDPASGQLVFLAGDNNTLDPTEGTDSSLPLFLDSALSDGLTAGDYYLAVADGSNTPSPIEGQIPDSPGILDPNQPGSAQDGWSTGPYLLSLMVQPTPAPPQVVASSPAPGQVFDQAPTQITVQFSEPVDLQQLAYQAFEVTYQSTLPQVYIEGADGTRYEPRFLDYDRTSNTATFQVLDELPDGSYTLHLSGPGGLTDLAGDPLTGNDPSGDEVIPFSVQAPAGAVSGGASGPFWAVAQPGAGTPQDIGLLFPDQIQAGVSLLRYPMSPDAPAASSTQDSYVIQLPQDQDYSFELIGDDLPDGTQVTMTDASGQPVGIQSSDEQSYFAFLAAGTYTISVGGWSAGAGADAAYQLLITFGGQQDNPPALVDGPSPALEVSFVTTAASAGSPSGGVPVVPGPVGGIFAPVAGEAGGTGGGVAGPVASSGGSGAADPGGGSGAADPSGPATAGAGQFEAAIGLAGLGMGPLGGSGGQSGTIDSPAVQVAINVPSAGPTTSSPIAVSLVTLTQLISWDRDGQEIEPSESPAPPVIEADGPPGSSEEAPANAVVAGGAIPGLEAGAPAPGPAVAEPRAAAAVASGEGAGAPAAVAVAAAPIVAGSPRSGQDDWTTRWFIAAATLAAVIRSRRIIRNLDWKKGTRGGRAHPAHVVMPRSSRGPRPTSPRP